MGNSKITVKQDYTERIKTYYHYEGIDIIIKDDGLYSNNKTIREKFKLKKSTLKRMKQMNSFSGK